MNFPVILRILLPLMLGVILHFYTAWSVPTFVLLISLMIGALLLIPQLYKAKTGNIFFTIWLTLNFFLLGGFLSEVNSSIRQSHYFIQHEHEWSNYLVQIIEPPVERENSLKCVVKVKERDGETVNGKTLIYLQKSESAKALEYGDFLYLNARFNPIRSNGNPKEFDYARYLRIHDIHHQTYIKTSKWLKVGEGGNELIKGIFAIRSYLSGVLQQSGMSSKNSMVANALILGQKEYLDKDVLRSYSSAGAMHVLAVSGLHVGIIMLILTALLKPIKKYKWGKHIYLIAVLGGIWFYALITGMSPSVMRAGVMFTFIVVGQEMQRDTTVYQSILVSAFLLILIDPYIIFQVGFQLSYMAVLGIVYLQPKIENLFYVKNKVLFKIWQISAVSIAAQIATFPLGLYYFHQFPNFFLISNLIVIPLAFCILIVGITFLVFHSVPYLSDVIFWVFDKLISLLNAGVEWVEKLPYSILWGISIEWYEVFLLYITILLGSIAFIQRKSRVLLASLAGVIILLVINVWENERLKKENVLTVYNINDEVAVDIFEGRKNVFISSQDLMNDEEKLLFHVKHHWFYRTGSEEPDKWMDLEKNQLFKFNKQSFQFISGSSKKFYQSDYVIFHQTDYIEKKVLETLVSSDTKFILAGGVSYSLRNFLERDYADFICWDVTKNGAFQLKYE